MAYHFIDYIFGNSNIGNVDKVSMREDPEKVEIRLPEEEPHLERIKEGDNLFLYDLDNDEIFAIRKVLYKRNCKLSEITRAEQEIDNNRNLDNISKVMSKIYKVPVTYDSKVLVIRHRPCKAPIYF